MQPLFKINIFWPAKKFFFYLLQTILEDEVHVMTLPNQLALKQTTNLQTMTGWLQNSTKTFIKTYL